MSDAVAVLVPLALGTYALKAAGPLLLGGRPLPAGLDRLSLKLPAALLAALVVVSTVEADGGLAVDARLAGVVVAAGALRLRLPFAVVVAVAVGATALTRAVVGG